MAGVGLQRRAVEFCRTPIAGIEACIDRVPAEMEMIVADGARRQQPLAFGERVAADPGVIGGEG